MKPQLGPFPDIFRRQLPALTILSLVVTLAACTPAPQKVIMPDPGNTARTKYCGGYAEVAAARSGGGELPVSEVSNAGEPARSPAKGN